jgi:hypothetical protein
MLRRRSLRVTIQVVALVTSVGVLKPTTTFAQSQNLNLSWNPSADADVDGYRLYVGTTPSAQDGGVYTIPASQIGYAFAATPGVLYYFAVSAVNAAGVEGPRSETVSGAIPLLSPLGNRTSTLGLPIVGVQLFAYDPDGGTVRFTHTGLPPGLLLDSVAGTITGIPLSIGTFPVTVFASDGLLSTSRSFEWTVRSPGSGDTTAPRLLIASPTQGQSVPSSVTVSGTATDAGLGDSGIVRVTVNGQLANGGTASGSGTANWSRTVTLSGTSSTILVEAVDGAGNYAAELITVNRAPPQITVTSLTSNLASPQAPGTSVRFAASAAGGTAPYQFKWWVLSGGVWYVAQNWSTSTTLNWQPTASGTYMIAVWGRNAGVTADASQAMAQVPFVISNTATPSAGSAPLSIASFTSDLSSPSLVAREVTFAATATGGSGVYEFKWWLQSGGVWRVIREWNSSPTLRWYPTTADSYVMAVWARNAGATADAADALAQMPFVVSTTLTSTASSGSTSTTTSGNSTLPSITSFTSDLPSPRIVGTEITFAATAAGGTGAYEFKWWIQFGGTWSILREWNSTRTLLWQPTTASSYVIAVWARNAGVTTDASQGMAQMSYVISPRTTTSTALSITSFSSNPASPQVSGTAITFWTGATGGTAPYQFKWWVLSGGVWTVAQDWNTSTSMTWRPASTGTYVVAVWARNAGVTADASQAMTQVSYVISAAATSALPSGSSAPVSITSFTSDLSSPRLPWTEIRFAATAAGGTGVYEFKWWILSGGVWRVMRDWNSSSTVSWFPTTAGSYVIAVWARRGGSTIDASEALAQAPFVITP